MATTYDVAAVDALVAHLQAGIDAHLVTLDAATPTGTIAVSRAWHDERGMAPTKRATVTVFAGEPDEDPGPSVCIGIADGARLFVVASWTGNIQIDVETDERALCDELLPVVRRLLSAVPVEGGLTLTVSAYHGEKVRFRVVGTRRPEQAEQPLGGPWRAIVEVRASGRVVVAEAVPETPIVPLAEADVSYTDPNAGDVTSVVVGGLT